MRHTIKSILFVLLLTGLLIACTAPATAEPILEPTPVPIVATAIPDIQSDQITIPAEGGEEEVKVIITGNGDTAVMMHKSRYDTDTTSRWAPLVDILSANEKLRMATYTLRYNGDTAVQDSRAVFDYLRAQGINKIICMSAGLTQVCSGLEKELEIIGMVIFPGDNLIPIEADFPKLFITAEDEPRGLAARLQQTYEDSAEPKIFKSYPAAAEGAAIFLKADVGPQVLADITDFINGIVNRQ